MAQLAAQSADAATFRAPDSEEPAPHTAAPEPSSYEEEMLIVQILRAIPVVGWFVADAIDGRPDAKYFFIFNLLVLVGAAVFLFGYGAVILLALAATAVSMIIIMMITLG